MYYKPTPGIRKPDDTEDMVEEAEVDKDNEQGDTSGDGDAELVKAAKKKKKVRKEKLSGKIEESTGRLCCLVSEVSGALETKSYNRTFFPQCHRGPLQHGHLEESSRQKLHSGN